MNELILFLNNQDVEFKCDVSLKEYSSIKIGGIASVIAFPDSFNKLKILIDFLEEKRTKYRVVGRMTNLLPSDSGYDGVIIITRKINSYSYENNRLTCDCGATFSKIIRNMAKFGIGGFESLYGIPGSVGGMVYSNAGAYGCEISDFLIKAKVYLIKEKLQTVFDNSDFKFAYRDSILKKGGIILLDTVFRTHEKSKENILLELGKIKERRLHTQPIDKPSVGSVFKRTELGPASLLIDKAGMKGISVGGAQISKKHAGFIINKGNATSVDFFNLTELVKEQIKIKYSFVLEEEFEKL